MENGVDAAESEYQARLGQLDGGFASVASSFSSLESKISGVSGTAVRIGEQLESLHKSRRVAQGTSLVLSYYISIGQEQPAGDGAEPSGDQTTPATPLDALFATRTSREGRSRLAIIFRRLQSLAMEVATDAHKSVEDLKTRPKPASTTTSGKPDKAMRQARAALERADRVRDTVEKYCERFEKECLRLFDRSYRKGDVRMMAHCARVLQDFNNGTSCVQMYVNQHDFFISKDRVIEEATANTGTGEKDIWTTINDPDAPPPTSEPGLRALFQEIRVTVSQEAQIIQAVFPVKEEVMRVFLQRVFAQVIGQYLERLFARSAGIGTLALLRMLKLTHSACSAIVDDLKQYDFQSDGQEVVAPQAQLPAQLDQYLEELFSPYLDATRYVELESRWLGQGYNDLLSKFVRYHQMVAKNKPNTLLDRVVHQISNSAGSTAANTSASAASAASAAASWLHKYGGVSAASKASPVPSRTSTPVAGQRATPSNDDSKPLEVDGVLNLKRGEQMLRWHAEAISRAAELSPANDAAKHILTLARILQEHFFKSQLELSLVSLLSRLENLDAKHKPDAASLFTLRQAVLLLQLWQGYTSTALIPLLGSSVTYRKELVKSDEQAIAAIERRMNSILHKIIDLSIAWLTTQLKKQKQNDYRPRDDDLSFARTTTEACSACCEYLDEVKESANVNLSGRNREVFFTELGVAFHSLLLDHYKKFPVNPTGGLMLTKDLAAYQDVFADLGIPPLSDRFDMLRQLGNSFIVQPEVLKSYLTESHLGRLDARLLQPYLMQRSDWQTFARRFAEEAGFPINADEQRSTTTTATHKGHIRTASRLSLGVGAAGMNKLRDMLKEIDRHAASDSIHGRL